MKKLTVWLVLSFLFVGGVIITHTDTTAQKTLLTIKNKAACEAAGGVWTSNPLFPCAPKNTSTPVTPNTGETGPPPVDTTTPPGTTNDLEKMKENFLAWATKTHWAKRRTEIIPQIEEIKKVLPEGVPKLFLFIQFGDTGFVGQMDIFDRLVIVDGAEPKDALSIITGEKKRDVAARILYYLSGE